MIFSFVCGIIHDCTFQGLLHKSTEIEEAFFGFLEIGRVSITLHDAFGLGKKVALRFFCLLYGDCHLCVLFLSFLAIFSFYLWESPLRE